MATVKLMTIVIIVAVINKSAGKSTAVGFKELGNYRERIDFFLGKFLQL